MSNVKSELWAVTLKLNVPNPTVHDYVKIIASWRDKGAQILSYEFEREPNETNKLHIHGILKLPVNYYRKTLAEDKLHYHLVSINDLRGWINYMVKNKGIPKE